VLLRSHTVDILELNLLYPNFMKISEIKNKNHSNFTPSNISDSPTIMRSAVVCTIS